MKDIYSIVKSPVITEKATAQRTTDNKVAFWVALDANKDEIRAAVEKLFKVKVVKVNTERTPGKYKRVGKYEGSTSTRKKAYVTLKEGDKIQLFEGV